MNSFDFGEFDKNSREVLKKVVEEIREQFLVNGHPHQFWFYPTQVSDATLTAPIIQKWLQVLLLKGVLYYYRPINAFDFVRDLVHNALNLPPHKMQLCKQLLFPDGFSWTKTKMFTHKILA